MSLRQWLANRVPAASVRSVAAPYVAGDSLQVAIEHADELWRERGIRSTLDALGEQVESPDRAAHALELYLEAAERSAERPWISLSIKPGHFGFHLSPELCERNVRKLAERCQSAQIRLTLDMEDRDLTEGTVALYRRLRPDFSVLGMVLQSKLFRTEQDLESLAGLGARVRLCIGVYGVPATAGHRRKKAAKDELLRLLPRALELLDVVEIATHDELVIAEARRIVEAEGMDRSRVEFQMLLGVPRRGVQDELVRAGYDVRLYVPFAEAWDDAVAYLRRRMAESPSLAMLVLRNMLDRSE